VPILSRTDSPRTNREPEEIARKLALLEAPHIAPLTGYVRSLRASRGGDESIPWFDPTDAGVDAPILVLLEPPGRRATAKQGSGFISADNDDPTAANAWRLYREAGINRRADVVVWNVIPWYIGTDRAVRGWTNTDLDEARDALGSLISLLPRLGVVVLQGRAAQQAWDLLGIEMPVIRAPHPSPRSLNTRPQAWEEILNALRAAKALAIGDQPYLQETAAKDHLMPDEAPHSFY
jgi:Uracil DNA glycosylase superfamily